MISETLLQKKIPLVYFVVLLMLSAGVCYVIAKKKDPQIKVVEQPFNYGMPVNRVRLNSYRLTHPLLFADREMEDTRLFSLKDQINRIIEEKKGENIIIDASVYFRNLNDGGWFALNKETTYTPASLQKVTIMMAYLKDAEKNPAMLNKTFYFEKHFSSLPSQNIKVFSLQEHKSYPVKELLHYMIAYSDNDALNILYQNMNTETYRRLFTDLQLSVPNLETDNYYFTVRDYTIFFRILYNSTYLTHDLSDYALQLLTQCTFKNGITKNLDSTLTVAHKFGERVDGNLKQLHEFAIVYAGNQPYLLGIMTKGYDFGQLGNVITGISDLIYGQTNPPSSSPTVERYFTEKLKSKSTGGKEPLRD